MSIGEEFSISSRQSNKDLLDSYELTSGHQWYHSSMQQLNSTMINSFYRISQFLVVWEPNPMACYGMLRMEMKQREANNQR